MTEAAAATAAAAIADPAFHAHRSLWGDVWRQFRAHRGAMIGVAVFTLIALVVLVGPFLHTLDPQFLNMRARNQPMSWAHPFGTDNVGRDMLAQVMAGGRVSLAVGVAAMAISVVLGALVGVLAGYAGPVSTVMLMSKQIRLIGITVGTRRQQQDMIRAVEANGIKPVIDRTFPLAELGEAFKYQATGGHFGKICVSL